MTASFDGYHGVFCPHVLGTKDGVWRVHAWQFGGGSSTKRTCQLGAISKSTVLLVSIRKLENGTAVM